MAEILGRRRSGERKNSGAPRCSFAVSAVFRCFLQQCKIAKVMLSLGTASARCLIKSTYRQFYTMGTNYCQYYNHASARPADDVSGRRIEPGQQSVLAVSSARHHGERPGSQASASRAVDDPARHRRCWKIAAAQAWIPTGTCAPAARSADPGTGKTKEGKPPIFHLNLDSCPASSPNLSAQAHSNDSEPI